MPSYETNVYYGKGSGKRSGNYKPIFIDARDVDLLGGPENFAMAVKSMTFREWEQDKPDQTTPWIEPEQARWEAVH